MDLVWQLCFYLVSFLLVTTVAIVCFYRHRFSYWKHRGVPTLNPMIPFGDAADLLKEKLHIGEQLTDWYLAFKRKGLKHGGAYFCCRPMYVPVDPQIIKRILITDAEYFPNHPFHIDDSGNDPMSTHLFNLENNKWRTLRSKLPSAFTSAKMRKMFLIMRHLTGNLTDKIDQFANEGIPVNVKEVFSCFTTDSISACGFGVQSNLLKGQNLELVKKLREFFDYQWGNLNNLLVFLVPRNVLKMLKFRVFTKSTTKYFIDMFSQIVELRSKDDIKRNDLTDLLLKLTDEKDALLERDYSGKGKMEPLSRDEMMAEMYFFMAAGFETSSSTGMFAMLELSLNIECQEKLRKEINDVLSRYNGEVTYDGVMEMQYLDQVVDETLRKDSIIPVVPRLCAKDYYVSEADVTIEKGTFVVVSNMGLQRDPEYWPEPEKFDPDRFTLENKRKRPGVAFLPFGEGPRVCIGKRFGVLQTKLGLITMIKNYKFTINSRTLLPFKYNTDGIILRTAEDIYLNVEKIIDQ